MAEAIEMPFEKWVGWAEKNHVLDGSAGLPSRKGANFVGKSGGAM